MKRTKIVATISDKRCEIGFLRELYEAGMNVVRLNTAHETLDEAMKSEKPDVRRFVGTEGNYGEQLGLTVLDEGTQRGHDVVV